MQIQRKKQSWMSTYIFADFLKSEGEGNLEDSPSWIGQISSGVSGGYGVSGQAAGEDMKITME